jgi:hypothetical protein
MGSLRLSQHNRESSSTANRIVKAASLTGHPRMVERMSAFHPKQTSDFDPLRMLNQSSITLA